MTTQWREIPGHNGYQASDDGRIRSTDRTILDRNGRTMRYSGKELTPSYDAHGYLRVDVFSIPQRVNRLVCLAFHGTPAGDQPHAAHRNGNRLDNRPENLYWATRSENERDKIRHGVHPQANRTHCVHGHEFTPENTYPAKNGRGRDCRTCRKRRDAERYAAKKASA